MEHGVVNYIEKPYSMDYLLACIKGALDKRAMLRDTYRGAPAIASKVNIINRDDDFLKKLQNIVMENLSNPDFSNKQLEELLYMGHSTLNRKMKYLLNTTPNDYIRTKRLSAAADMLVSGGYRVSEVSYAVGFNSPSYFAKCFKNAYGMLPAEYVKVKSGKADQ
jgi:AraC-like DNA-binding protein